ncbi:MAG TPA: circularly permuted type 2 ATP-grasp protein [Polyangiaceae bacterium]|nr:circularly permuted type 2 ATP-grasp protein [Polyangiaceae bacterium]
MVSPLESRNEQAVSPAASPAYDEFWELPGVPRRHQRLLHAHLTGKNFQELDQIQKAVRRRITEQEVTFNILGVPEGTNRPWQLDSVPLVLSREDWASVELGLQQRAEVINLYLTDCFGPQRALKDGVVPPELVFGHPSFPRACHGWTPLGAHYLWLYAADLGRAEDGAFRLYSDRTASPTGAGYALENRLVLGRALAELFRDYSVERVASFFGKVRDCLASLAPRARTQPRVVVLTAGAGDESSFEHAYLARYLGYELVEGRDLTVRERSVYLKTLSGLRRVDVVLRRVFDDLCDPLYLRADSGQGVPGLVTSALYGQVALANPLGAAIAEAPALKAYLPALCRYYTGEDLALEAVPTHWCGNPESLAYVLAHLEELHIKPAFSDRRGEPHRPALMDQKARSELVGRIQRRPADFVAERWSALSVAPSLGGNTFASGRIALRAFLCRAGDDYAVMPGGLARLDSAPDGIFLSLRSQAASKDVWIAGSGAALDAPLPAMPDQRVELRRGGLDLPSRLLDDIYWLGRSVERCDVTARLVRAGLERVGLEAGPDAHEGLNAILAALRAVGATREPAAAAPAASPASSAEALLLSALLSNDGANSLPSNLGIIHQLTLSVRSRLSRDAWQVLRTLSTALERVSREQLGSGAAIDVLDQLLTVLAAVSGTMCDNMVRGHAWIFLDMGRRVERGALTLQLLQTLLPARASRVHMEALLEIADSLLTYRARYLSALQVAPVVDLLLTDASNPRSLAFQIDAIMRHLTDLPRSGDAVRSRAERSMIMLQSNLLTADVALACSGDGSGLRELLEDAHRLLWQFSDEVTQTWFSHAESSKALSPPAWIDEDLEAT